MSRTVRAALATLPLIIATVLGFAAPAAAATCDTRSSSGVSGGYSVTIYCSGAGFIVGYGNTVTAANLEALNLYQLYAETGVLCDGRAAGGATGGYYVRLYCSGAGFSDAYGSSLSEAASEGRLLAKLYGETGQDCDGRGVRSVSAGYEVTLHCTRGGFITGVGGTLSGAALTARMAASVG